MPSEGSNDSWSRATAPGPEKTARKPASGGQPDPPPSEPEEPGDEASSTATSEIKSMLRRRMKQEENYRPKSSLGSVKVEEFYGDRSRYLKWKRTIQAQQHLYALEGGKLAMFFPPGEKHGMSLSSIPFGHTQKLEDCNSYGVSWMKPLVRVMRSSSNGWTRRWSTAGGNPERRSLIISLK